MNLLAKKKRTEVRQRKREIIGIVLIALGVFLGVCLYTSPSTSAPGIVAAALRDFLSGLFGLFSYALPPALLIGGISLIASSSHKPKRGRVALVLVGIVLLLTLLHTIVRPIIGETTFFPYIGDAYTYGVAARTGGGAIGSILCYPLLKYLGEAGTYIFTIAGLLIVILLTTSLSLKKTGEQVGRTVRTGVEHVKDHVSANRSQLYTETLADEPVKAAPKKTLKPPKAPRKPSRPEGERPDVDFIPAGGTIPQKARGAEAARPQSADSLFVEDVDAPPFDLAEDKPMKRGDEPPKITIWEPDSPSKDAPPFEVVPVQTPAKKAVETAETEVATGVPAPPPVYVRPPIELLNRPNLSFARGKESPQETGKLLVDTLATFNINCKLLNIVVGPVITRFELQPAPGVRVNRITSLADDIALALAATRVRIEAPIPGKSAVGIEVPNKDTVTVVLRDIIEAKEFKSASSTLTMALGKDIAGKTVVADLGKMPHMLIAGATGSGKSVCINDIIMSLVYKSSPAEVRMILVDPKQVELKPFGVLPHLLIPVVTDPKKAAGALRWAVNEMDTRYKNFSECGARDIARFNELQTDETKRIPKIVIIIDELADLMMVAPDDVEASICRIAQLGRAAGMHLIVATQRPSADIITGLIKANIPSRAAFAVSSSIDSRIILDAVGAEKLLGRGDMLFHPNGAGKPTRLQCAFVSDEEVERITDFFAQQTLPSAFDERVLEDVSAQAVGGTGAHGEGKQEDELLGEAVRIVLDSGQASISMIQRRLRVGYARAARLVDIMEQRGFVSGFEGSKPRKVLITRSEFESIFGNGEEKEIQE